LKYFPSCGANEFHCQVDKCVPQHYVCDGDNDCGDMSDEDNCTEATTGGDKLLFFYRKLYVRISL